MKRTAVIATLLTLIASFLAAFGPSFPGEEAPTLVVRAYYTNPELVRDLAGWLEPWQHRRDAGYVVLETSEQDRARLEALGFRVEIDQEQTSRLRQALRLAPGQTSGIPGYPCFRTVDETLATAQRLTAAYPTLAAWVDIGDSWEKTAYGNGHGDDLRVLRLTNAATSGTKARLFAMSGLHARELATTELLTRFAEALLTSYGSNAEVTHLLDTQEIHLLLQSNPDGRRQAEAGLFWRKNTDARFCSPTSNYRGVDLNRNFSFYWNCCGGGSNSTCSELYRGPYLSSEPEVQAIQAYLRSQFPDRRGTDLNDPAPLDVSGLFLDIHSYGREVVWSWGFTDRPAPNATGLQTLGRKLAFFNRYEPYPSYYMYTIDGASDDFAYGDLGLPAYTIELGDYFFESCTTFDNNILPDNLNLLFYAARISSAPYRLPSGPDVHNIQTASAVFPPFTHLTVEATLNDTRFYTGGSGSEPNQPIADAEFTLGAAPGDAAAPILSGKLIPVDGAWDEPVEQATATIDISALAIGRYPLYLRAQDAAGNWGPVSARYVLLGMPSYLPMLIR